MILGEIWEFIRPPRMLLSGAPQGHQSAEPSTDTYGLAPDGTRFRPR